MAAVLVRIRTAIDCDIVAASCGIAIRFSSAKMANTIDVIALSFG